MKIQIFDLKFDQQFIENFKSGCEKILQSDSLSEGNYVKEFESKFSKLVNAKHAISVNSGTAALEIALKAVNVSGKHVIMPSNTFFATSIAITNAGGKITLVDSELDNFSICPKALEKSITSDTGAVIVVHIGGIISKNIKKIKKICDNHGVPLIEDAAHAHCSRLDNLYAGTIGDIGCFSFFPTKVMTTGEGGMITTNSDMHASVIKTLKNFGRPLNDKSICSSPMGQNAKINEFTGLLGSLECDRVMQRIQKRNILLERYCHNLKNTQYEVVKQLSGYCSYYKCILKTKLNTKFLKEYCKKNGITCTGEVYSKPVHMQPLYKTLKHGMLPNTEQIASGHICPPLYPELNFDHIDYICKVLKEAEKIG